MKKILLVLILIASTGYAVPEYYSISKSVRALGMGGAFYGLSDDEYALFYNPAGLNLYRGEGRLMLISPNVTLSPDVLTAINAIQAAKGQKVDGIANTLSQFQGETLYAGAGATLPYYLRKNFAIAFLPE